MGIRIPQSNVSLTAADKAITKEMHDGLGRATTAASSLAAEQESGNITKTQTKATPPGPSSPRTSSEGGPGCHFTMGDSPVQARPKRLSNLPYEPPLKEGNTSRSGEGSMQYLELMEICTKLSSIREEEQLLTPEMMHNQVWMLRILPNRMIKELDKDENVNLVQSSKQGEA
nr:hypothetical protein [Tanacetum cinerariifolium]